MLADDKTGDNLPSRFRNAKADAKRTVATKILNLNEMYRSAKPLFVGSIPTRASKSILWLYA